MPPPLSSPLILEEATPGVVGIEHGEAPGTVEEEGTWSVESVNATMAIDAAEIVLETGAPSPEAPLASAEVSAEPEAPEATPVSIKIDEAETNLHVDLYKSFASSPPPLLLPLSHPNRNKMAARQIQVPPLRQRLYDAVLLGVLRGRFGQGAASVHACARVSAAASDPR